jgi:hypothetical protein
MIYRTLNRTARREAVKPCKAMSVPQFYVAVNLGVRNKSSKLQAAKMKF